MDAHAQKEQEGASERREWERLPGKHDTDDLYVMREPRRRQKGDCGSPIRMLRCYREACIFSPRPSTRCTCRPRLALGRPAGVWQTCMDGSRGCPTPPCSRDADGQRVVLPSREGEALARRQRRNSIAGRREQQGTQAKGQPPAASFQLLRPESRPAVRTKASFWLEFLRGAGTREVAAKVRTSHSVISSSGQSRKSGRMRCPLLQLDAVFPTLVDVLPDVGHPKRTPG